MEASGADDATDFRPFFDMVIGILFVLLILVAAQIYFQQAEDHSPAAEAQKREAALRKAEVASFLGTLAGRLRDAGIGAAADVEAGAVVLPLADVVALDRSGLPAVDTGKAGSLGSILAGMAACVTLPRATAADCLGYDRLHLDDLSLALRLGAMPRPAALPRDRFGVLAETLLSASLLQNAPALIGVSNDSGGRVMTFGALQADTPVADATATDLGGEVVLDFTFH